MSTKSQREKARALRYGMTRIREGQKMAWITRQNKNGWSLGLALNSKTLWLRNTRFQSIAQVRRALYAPLHTL